MMVVVHTVREHEKLQPGPNLTAGDISELGDFARTVLKRSDGDLAAANYVGVVSTSRGTMLEILPKIDLVADGDDESTRRLFLSMLRSWRGMGERPMPPSHIRAIARLPMLEAFVREFLKALTLLARGGLAKRYRTVEQNQPYLRGRLLFRHHLRENVANQARFFIAHAELSKNRPANRLIQAALHRLAPRVRDARNRELLGQLRIAFADIPPSSSIHGDWRAHHVDRSMRHYGPVMQWVGLFLFHRGLATFSGTHENVSLLFPMEQVFEDFVTASFRRHQRDYRVRAQGPGSHMATLDGKPAFQTRPDITLAKSGKVAFVLDAKWKRMEAAQDDVRHGIAQDDVYQMHAYAGRYECRAVALVYPTSRSFAAPYRYRLFDGRTLFAAPFDVTDPEGSVRKTVQMLEAA
ncbi:MAG: hypothetical protein F4Y26_18990 [Gammaproteobacteria bacterium]|nr:hypothetical protein [Gammaproteobacteria bacterium]